MEMKEAVRDLAKRSRVAKDTAETEEATKNGVILPFIRALGFDVFDLSQVVPEFTADVGVKKGEKVDYALKIDGEIVMIVEAKPISMDLGDAQFGQLYRYFSVTDARIAVLANGAQFWFFSDIDEKNKMDKRPFFKFDLESFDDDDVRELTKFHREKFNIATILDTAATLKYTTAAATFLRNEMANPSDEMVKIVGRQIYDGNMTKAVVEQLRSSVMTAFSHIVSDKFQERLDAAFSSPKDGDSSSASSEEAEKEKDNGIETTADEWEAFYVVRSIASEFVSAERVVIRDARSYCSILLDNNNRKTICRFHFNAKSVKYVGFFDASKKESRERIDMPSDIYKFREKVKEAVERFA